MNAVEHLEGRSVLLPNDDVDTDQIMPKQHCARITRTGYEDALFEGWRHTNDVPLNESWARTARFLIVGENFGCGSSREHAVWGLVDYGFRAIVGLSFADTFRSNCASNGLATATVTREAWEHIVECWDRSLVLGLSVRDRELRVGADAFSVEMPSFDRELLLSGKSALEVAGEFTEQIAVYEARRPSWLPSANTGAAEL